MNSKCCHPQFTLYIYIYIYILTYIYAQTSISLFTANSLSSLSELTIGIKEKRKKEAKKPKNTTLLNY